ESYRGSETILLVEDEQEVRTLVSRSLQQCGYTVLEAENGAAALEIARRRGDLDLIITDLVMPVMGGNRVAEQLSAEGSRVKFLFMSGYSELVVTHCGLVPPAHAFLEKPFVPDVLLRKVRAVLDSIPS